jgi:molybdate transport system substrate-binding protein
LSSFLYCLLLVTAPLPAAQITVAAASDLSAMQDALAAGFQKASGHTVRFALGSSGALARQIKNGAPYDAFLSANQEFVDELVASGQIAKDSVVSYANGRLALWSKDGRLRNLMELDAPAILHISIANPAHAPYGVAAQQALEAKGLWSKLKDKLVYAENVRQAWEYARSGNADATLTSWTLVYPEGGILIPEEWHRPIRQVAGVVTGSGQEAVARQFLAFLGSPEGRAILRKGGLFPAGK